MMADMLRSVGVLLLPGLELFEFGVLTEVFGIDRRDLGVPRFDFEVCSPRPGEPIVTQGVSVTAGHGLEALVGKDLVAVPACAPQATYSPEVHDALRAAADAGSILLSVCSGVFALGAAGLLDGRPCTGHWGHIDQLREMYPLADVRPDVLFVDDGDLITSAGTAAGIDACLHLVRREMGSRIATVIARRMVVPPQRQGGQKQYVLDPVPERSGDSLEPVMAWVRSRLHEPHDVRSMARRAAMSERTFARRFVAETGTTPHQWLLGQRILRARDLLETTTLDIESVARRSGFGGAATLRQQFRRAVGISPHAYRQSFSRLTS